MNLIAKWLGNIARKLERTAEDLEKGTSKSPNTSEPPASPVTYEWTYEIAEDNHLGSPPAWIAAIKATFPVRSDPGPQTLTRPINTAIQRAIASYGKENHCLPSFDDVVRIINLELESQAKQLGISLPQFTLRVAEYPALSHQPPKPKDNKPPSLPKIPSHVRPMHVYIPGKTRSGKSTLLHHLALADINHDHGLCLMDGKGDFIDKFIHYIPKHRIEDTIYLDTDTPVPLDFMAFDGEREKESLIGELKFLLTKTVESQHAPLMNANITDVLYTLFNYNENPHTPPSCRATFLDIYYFLDDPERRKVILGRLTDENLQRRWRDNFPNPVERSRITTRMTPFVRSPVLSKIFGAKTPKLNIADAVEQKKVLLVNLGPPDEIKRLYGTLLIAKIRQAVYRRAKIPASERTPFYLYCDEFQEFQTSDFDKMLSLAGGFGLCLTLAHQFVNQLEPRILQSIKGNVSTFICFRLGEESANCIRSEFPKPLPLTSVDKRRNQLTEELEQKRADLAYHKTQPHGEGDWALTYTKLSIILQLEVESLEYQLTKYPPPPEPTPDPAQFPFLATGEVLYRAADGKAYRCFTSPPPNFPAASYAEIIRKRTVDNYSCDTPQVCFTEGDEHRTPSDEISPTGPTVPPHHGKT
jgi:hypothetical protein